LKDWALVVRYCKRNIRESSLLAYNDQRTLQIGFFCVRLLLKHKFRTQCGFLAPYKKCPQFISKATSLLIKILEFIFL
jgi:hypothetical protein